MLTQKQVEKINDITIAIKNEQTVWIADGRESEELFIDYGKAWYFEVFPDGTSYLQYHNEDTNQKDYKVIDRIFLTEIDCLKYLRKKLNRDIRACERGE